MTSPEALPAKKSPKTAANMRMIAKKAGVSATTVSLALRDMPSVSQETKERIYAIQHSMGYKLNRRMRRSVETEDGKLSQIIYRLKALDPREEIYSPFLHGMMSECASRSIKLELEGADASPLFTRPTSNFGVVISGRFVEEDLTEMERAGIPFVILGKYRLSRSYHMVSPDVFGAVETVLEDLVAEGMQHLTIVVEDRHHPYERECLRGLWGTLVDLGMPAGPEMIVELGRGFSEIEKAASTIVKRHKAGSRIVVLNQNSADVLAMELHRHHGAPIDKNDIIAFVGQAPQMVNRYYRTFDLGFPACARVAVGKLVELAKHPDATPYTSYLEAPGWQ